MFRKGINPVFKKFMCLVTVISLNLILSPGVSAQSTDGISMIMMGNYVATNPDTTKWLPLKAAKRGMRIVSLYGDPTKPGIYAYRLKMPSAYKMPPHLFGEKQMITVLKGTYWIGIGEKTDPMNLREFNAGAFFIVDGEAPRYTWARTEVIIEVVGEGPTSGIQYVYPGDDPRTRK